MLPTNEQDTAEFEKESNKMKLQVPGSQKSCLLTEKKCKEKDGKWHQ